MNYGQGAILPQTLPKPGGAPFPAGSANNGLSVDPGTGKIVLGNDVGGALAALLSNREIPMSGHKINFISNGGETMGIDSSNGVFPVMYNILNRNIQATGYFSRNLNNGVAAGIFDSVFNDIGTNVTYGCMSSLYNQPGSYAPDSPFIQANNTAVTASLSFLSQGGFFWAPFGNNNVTQSAMRMFTTGNLKIDAIGTNPFVDSGERLQVTGNANIATTIIDAFGGGMGLHPLNGSISIFKAGSASNVSIFNSALNDGVVIDSTNNIINSFNTANNLRLQTGTGFVGIGNIAATEKLHVNGNIKTADPGAGAGAWRLGTVVTAASVFDGTRYVEIMIGGVVVKLAVVT